MIQMEALIITDPGRGGANEKIAAQEIRNNQSAPPDSSTLPLKNCHTDRIGKIVKRNGYSAYTSGAITVAGSPDATFEEVSGLYQFRKHNGNTYEVACGSNGATQKIVNISTPASPADITGAVTFTDDTIFDFATVADTLLMTTTDRDSPIKWTGTGNCAALGGSPPAGKYVEEFFNYAFIANTSANPERVYWSGLYDVESWTTGSDFKRVNGAITGMCKRDEVLFIFTRTSITVCQYTGDSVNPFSFDILDTSVGCISQRSIVNIEGILYWLAGDGHIYRMGNFKPERATEAIPVTISGMNVGGFDIACGVDHRELRQYWCAVTDDSSTVNDFVLVIDYLNNEVFMYDGMNIMSIANFIDSNGDTKTYFGDRTGRVYLTNNGTSDYPGGTQTAINFWRYSKQFPLGNPGREKRLRRIKATVNNGGNYMSLIDVSGDFGNVGGQSLSLDHNGGGDLLGSTWVLGSSELGRIDDKGNSIDLAINCKYVQLKFHNNSYEQEVEIRDLELYYQNLGVGRN